MTQPSNSRRPLPLRRWSARAAALMAAVSTVCGWTSQGGAEVDPSITPTVHPLLLPSSAIQSTLKLNADRANVWKNGPEQRVMLSGHAFVTLGHRELRADDAAIWLTPGKE